MLYQRIAKLISHDWNYNGNTMLVAGATFPEELGEIRKIVGDTPLLVPGIGAQGGDLAGVLKNGLTADKTGLVINSSRGIIYASNGSDFAEAAGKAAQELKDQINADTSKGGELCGTAAQASFPLAETCYSRS